MIPPESLPVSPGGTVSACAASGKAMMAAASTQRIGTSSFFSQNGRPTAHSDIGMRNSSAQHLQHLGSSMSPSEESGSGGFDLSMIPSEKSVTFRDHAGKKAPATKT